MTTGERDRDSVTGGGVGDSPPVGCEVSFPKSRPAYQERASFVGWGWPARYAVRMVYETTNGGWGRLGRARGQCPLITG